MGRLLLLLLLVATFVLLWKAFGPGTWRRSDNEVEPLIKGPDDDEEFLWRLELEQFKKLRVRVTQEMAAWDAQRKAHKAWVKKELSER